jgi:hypothetical protein
MDASLLRPLRIPEILDAGIKITTRRFAALAKLVAVVTIPIQVLSALVLLSTFSDDTFDVSTTSTTAIDRDFWVQQAGNLVVSLLGMVATLVALAACTRLIAGAYFGEEADWRESLRYAGRRLPSLLWVGFLFALLVGLGTLACIVPGVWLFVSYSVSVPVLLVEGIRGWESLKRSFRLVRGRWWPTFAVLLLGYLLINIVQTVISLPALGVLFAGDSPNVVVFVVASAVSGTVSTVLTTPFLVAMIFVVYVDLRVRKEGLDLQLMAQRVGAPPPSLGSLPPWATSPPPGWSPPPPPGWSPPPRPGWSPPPPPPDGPPTTR